MTSPAAELLKAAKALREVAPDITGPLSGLADPVAAWLDVEAFRATTSGRGPVFHHALAVARAINGRQP
ncbi:hypothetical protein [Streptomyces formicae]